MPLHPNNTAVNRGGLIRNLILVSGSNLLQLVANIALGLLLPVLLDIENFGFYKIYTLYVGYIGLLHFGFVDGILLEYGGQDYIHLNKMQFRTYTKMFIFCEAICTLVIIISGILFFQGSYRMIAILVGSNLIINNVTLYYQYLSQATSRFKEFSLRKVLNSLAIIVLVIILLVFKWIQPKRISFGIVIAALQVISLFLLVWYIWTYRDITFGKSAKCHDYSSTFASICKKGFLLTISYEVANLILLLNRQFVSLLFPVEVYAQYAFAYNLLSCVTALVTAISTVIFPMLKRMKQEQVMQLLPLGVSIVTVLVCFALTGYYVVVWLVNLLLPHYCESLGYLRIVFPAMALSSSITIIMFTFYKVLDKISAYFMNSLFALIIAFFLNIIAYSVWNTPDAISVASVISIIIWYVLISTHLSKLCHVDWRKNFIYALAMMTLFYLSTMLPCGSGIKCIVYFISVCTVSFIGYRNIFREIKEVSR